MPTWHEMFFFSKLTILLLKDLQIAMIYVLRNTIQNYAWGSRTILAELLRQPVPANEPQAELWMGTHPKAPSQIELDGTWVTLDQAIHHNLQPILSSEVALRFGALPFLFKILAVATPLSVQIHPNAKQAVDGFQHENDLGIDIKAPHRNYQDRQHKPEIICALSPFWMLNGFRHVTAMIRHLSSLQSPDLSLLLQHLTELEHPQGLKRFIEQLFLLPTWKQEQIIGDSLATIRTKNLRNPIYRWIERLHGFYPTDIGILFPAILHLCRLEPGQAVFINSGRMHSYLEGAGVELMANSDNVLRCALTTKHKNISELLRILHYEETPVNMISPREIQPGEKIYPAPVAEFLLSKIKIKKEDTYFSRANRSVEIMICTNGYAEIQDLSEQTTIRLYQGTAVLIPASVAQYCIKGNAELYKATVPDHPQN